MDNKCFSTSRFIDCTKGQCLSYANGKSVGRVKNGIKFRGCHYFSGKVFNIGDDKLLSYILILVPMINGKVNLIL